MKKIALKNHAELPILGMGTWFMAESASRRQEEIKSIRYGIENGINFIDTAEMYGNGRVEQLIGEAIQPYPRESIYLLSKVLPNNANKYNMEIACDNSLKALKTDYLDMYLYHWRGVTPLTETIEELEKLKAKGKIKAWGVSNFDLEDMQELLALPAGKHCQVNEVLFHLGSRGIEYVLKPYQDKNSIPTIAYCPLAQAGTLQQSLICNPVVNSIAKEVGGTVYQVLLAFVFAQPNMIAIPKAGRIQHMKENIASLRIMLSKDQLDRLNNEFPSPSYRMHLDVV